MWVYSPGFKEVVVKIKATGLCHSDLSVVDDNRPRLLTMVLGYESAGVIIEIGKSVSKLREGSKCRIEDFLEIKYMCFGNIL